MENDIEMTEDEQMQDNEGNELMTDTPASPTCEQTVCSDPVWNTCIIDPELPYEPELNTDSIDEKPCLDISNVKEIENEEQEEDMYDVNPSESSPEKSEHSSDYERELESDSESDTFMTTEPFDVERSGPGNTNPISIALDTASILYDPVNSAEIHTVPYATIETENSETVEDESETVDDKICEIVEDEISETVEEEIGEAVDDESSELIAEEKSESKLYQETIIQQENSDVDTKSSPESPEPERTSFPASPSADSHPIEAESNVLVTVDESETRNLNTVPTVLNTENSQENSSESNCDSNVNVEKNLEESAHASPEIDHVDSSVSADKEDTEDGSLKEQAAPNHKDGEEDVADPEKAGPSETPEGGSVPDSLTNSPAASPSLEDEENEIKKLKEQIAAVDEEEIDEDLEEGEIEDDEETPAPTPVTEKQPPAQSTSNTSAKDKDKEKSSSRHRHYSSSKDKDKDKDSRSKTKEKEKEKEKSDRRRKHSVDNKDGSKDKSNNKKRIRRSEDVSAGDEDYLFVRGASPPPQTDLQPNSSPSNAGRKIYDTDPFGNPIYEDELENDFPMSPAAKRRRKSRSPLGERRRREESRGSRRPNSGRKDPIKPLHKSDQICAYYMQGKCQKSHEECSFSHNAVPPRKMELCKFWMLDCCAKKEKCLYLHNDFPCKYYHTGLVCKLGLKNQCKFSHKPMNEVTKAVLLKHIETAPKEILGDFPRLNRQGALNLIAKMENKINGELKKQERERDEERRRTRWEQPTKEDENKLQELMEEAGLGNLYQETVEGASQRDKYESNNSPRGDRDHRKHHHHQQHNSSGGISGIAPLMGILPNQLPPPLLPPQPHLVNNPALANVLANLHIPSTTIQRTPVQDGKENNSRDLHGFRDESYSRESRISPDSPPHQSAIKIEPKVEPEMNILDNLPPMQRGIFRRIQEQQLKNEKKIKDEPSDDERPDDRGWYSSDEETDKPLTEVLKEIPAAGEQKSVVDFASVLSAIRKTAAAAPSDSEPDAKRSKTSAASPPLSAFPGRGDVDFRIGGGGAATGLPQMVSDQPSTSQGPFRDTDFRVPPALRQEFKDVDLRMTEPKSGRRSPVPVFKPLPTGPATMIDAAINSHPPMTWRIRLVAGVKPPDYSYVKHTLTPAQLALDPRFGPRTAGGISLLPDPASPPQSTQTTLIGGISPANIPGEGVMDPRMSRRAGLGAQSADPRLGGDPRNASQNQMPQSLMPPGWPASVDMTQAALAAQLIAAQQLGLLPFPNPAGLPLLPPNFGDMNLNTRPTYPGASGRGSGPPSSSWERYSQQQSGGVTPPT